VDDVVFGSLVPWDGVWYWSGVQHRYPNVTAADSQHITQDFYQKVPQIVYRYCEARAENAPAIIRKHAQQFLDYHGTDMVRYPDGKAMAADLHTFHQYQFASAPQEDVEAFLTKHQQFPEGLESQ